MIKVRAGKIVPHDVPKHRMFRCKQKKWLQPGLFTLLQVCACFKVVIPLKADQTAMLTSFQTAKSRQNVQFLETSSTPVNLQIAFLIHGVNQKTSETATERSSPSDVIAAATKGVAVIYYAVHLATSKRHNGKIQRN